jgi:hypothetical protein
VYDVSARFGRVVEVYLVHLQVALLISAFTQLLVVQRMW